MHIPEVEILSYDSGGLNFQKIKNIQHLYDF